MTSQIHQSSSSSSSSYLRHLTSDLSGGYDMSLNLSMSAAQGKVKEERHDDAEIREMAEKMREAHKLQTAKNSTQQQQQLQMGGRIQNQVPNLPGGQANMMNYVTRRNNVIPATATTTNNGQTMQSSQMQSMDKSKLNENSSTSSTSGGTGSENGEKKPCDDESQRGHFGWATFGKTHIPYILRQGEKYCAVRMVETKLLNKYLSHLHQDIYSCTSVRSYYITDAESRLLNEINHKHCDAQFGREMFTLKDLVVRLSDANKFFQFLDICYKKLLLGSSGPSDKCGFIRINKESVVPYTVRDDQQFVPLFYFEGETENLKLKADYLSGWDLSYLKFCCKVQGIRNELFASDSVAVISLTDIKSYFPVGTEFEEYWPNKVVENQLLIGNSSQKSNGSSVQWTKQPSQPPPKVINPQIQKMNAARKQNAYANQLARQQAQQAAAAQAAQAHQAAQAREQQAQAQAQQQLQANQNFLAALQWQNLGGSMLSQSDFARVAAQIQAQAQVQAQVQQQQQRSTYSSRSSQISNPVSRQPYANYSSSALNLGSMSSQQIQQPPPLVRSSSQNSSTSGALDLHRRQQQILQQQHQRQMSSNLMMHQRPAHSQSTHQSLSPCYENSTSRYKIIQDVPSSISHQLHPPFKRTLFAVQGRQVPVTNLSAYSEDDYLMSVVDFNEHLFPNLSFEMCVERLSVLKIQLYIGNSEQVRVMGINPKVPFVRVRDVIQHYPQLSYMAQEQPQSKRARIS